MFLGTKNQYCENDYTTKHNLQIQCDPYQITNGIFSQNQNKNFHNSYGNTEDLEQPKQSREIIKELEESTFPTSDYITKLQLSTEYGTSTKTEIQTNEQDRKPRNKPMHLWVPYF